MCCGASINEQRPDGDAVVCGSPLYGQSLHSRQSTVHGPTRCVDQWQCTLHNGTLRSLGYGV